MTEGIIQEVFKRYYSRKFPDGFNDRIFYQIQQELIKKIKQEFQYCKPLLSLDKYTTLQKRLIGDNND